MIVKIKIKVQSIFKLHISIAIYKLIIASFDFLACVFQITKSIILILVLYIIHITKIYNFQVTKKHINQLLFVKQEK